MQAVLKDHTMSLPIFPGYKVIYICSSHPLARQKIQHIALECSSRIQLAKSIGELKKIIQEEKLDGDLLLLDTCSIPQWQECALRWQASGGKAILLVSPEQWNHSDDLRILYLGIYGVVPISDHMETDLPNAIASVNCGGLWVNSDALYTYIKKTGHAINQPVSAFKNLTAREEQIAVLIARGLSNHDIATLLEISVRTIKFHVSNILQKCKVENRKHLIVMSARLGPEMTSLNILKASGGPVKSA
jgi:DNA-binding NarL/FixJ family response regulator